MSRDRLDEIVDTELAPGQLTYSGRVHESRRIAERAFRHGVEQTIGQFAGFPVPNEWPGPQPAPAVEKWTPGCVCGACEIGHVSPCPKKDRRVGQRRSGCEWKAHGRYTRHLRHDNETWLSESRLDRRSGKDRRTPKG